MEGDISGPGRTRSFDDDRWALTGKIRYLVSFATWVFTSNCSIVDCRELGTFSATVLDHSRGTYPADPYLGSTSPHF